MSRLIVKNLPSGMKEERLRAMFSAFGTLTDCVLKFTKEGKFRRFAFVGFREEEDAERATRHFHRSFVDTSRISVERCKSFGDPTKPRAWSRRSHRSATPTEEEEEPQEVVLPDSDRSRRKKEKEKKKKRKEEEEESSDENFQEFLAVHQNRAHIPTWANDTPTRVKHKGAKDDYLNFDSDESDEDLEQEEDQEDEDECECPGVLHAAVMKILSDMDYLRSKVVSVKGSSVDAEGQDSDEDAKEELLAQLQAGSPQNSCSARGEVGVPGEGGLRGDTTHLCCLAAVFVQSHLHPSASKAPPATCNRQSGLLTALLRCVTDTFLSCKQQVREFMTPLKPVAIRIVRNAYGNKTGYVFVDLRSAEEVEKALRKDKDYMGGWTDPVEVQHACAHTSFQRQIREDEEEEEVSESGRLFVRNLPYTCNERELSDIFAQYGPLAEVHFPIDGLTKKPKGFAFVTYMIPEHAVRALAELDGHVFQGRMLHILPSTLKKEKAEQDPSGPGSSSFKKQRDAKQKAGSTSSHNWNTLFLGTNAVADAIAEKYSTTKSQVLDHESQGSLAVRMALGETQIVQETRQFLLDNHICLDSFSQAAGPRSNAVLLVKNLPAGVKVSELEAVFSPHGSLGRVLLPPSGLTAIVEFLEFSEAKRAFTRLAYTKFQHVPLYLEWAPAGVFSTPPQEKAKKPPAESNPEGVLRADAAASGDEEEEEEESVPGCTLFVKNLNFSTSEETLAEVFSKCGALKTCTVSRKKQRSGDLLSMGYGFVRYKTPKAAQKALRQLQHCTVDDHQLELKLSERATRPAVRSARTKQTARKQTTSKILVRNVPFQATAKELRELFGTFGELKSVRLPKKVSGTGAHRGFCFVDFLTKQDAKKAFGSLCHSTHLYGRRLVLEWADSEETIEALRRKTAERFHGEPPRDTRRSARMPLPH
uniref:RNA binding motif protein 19 n=1 Tax=Scleropages formosus TaxID=113540 RepID=A0A8C9TAE6_SCLFO